MCFSKLLIVSNSWATNCLLNLMNLSWKRSVSRHPEVIQTTCEILLEEAMTTIIMLPHIARSRPRRIARFVLCFCCYAFGPPGSLYINMLFFIVSTCLFGSSLFYEQTCIIIQKLCQKVISRPGTCEI